MSYPAIPFIPESSDGPGSRKILVTPEMAKVWLGLKAINRQPRPWAVENFVKHLQKGTFRYNGDPIRWDAQGRNFDGQHRLMAVEQSGVAAWLRVEWGLEEEAKDTVDIGLKRAPGDILAIHGIPGGRDLAATMSWLHRMENGTERQAGSSQGRVPSDMMPELFRRYPGATDSIKVGRLVGLSRRRVSPSMASALHYAMTFEDTADATLFFESIAEPMNHSLPEGDARRAFLNWHDNRRASTNVRLRPYIVLAYLTKAWNLWQADRQVDTLSVRLEGRKAEPFPRVQAFLKAMGKLGGEPAELEQANTQDIAS
jgi:hypothetical protein